MKIKTYKSLIKDLDRVYSIYVRTLYSKDGKVKCYTCDSVKPIKEMQNGHYISRRVLSTRFCDRNCKPQCPACNIFKEGNKPRFAINLRKEYGEKILDELDQLSRITVKYTTDKLVNMIEHYKKLTKKI